MKLLLDANLSPSLVARLTDIHPGSTHVFDHGDIASDDMAIWLLARSGGYVVVTKDTDFLQLSLLHGAPPKVVFLRLGNVSTVKVEAVLRSLADRMCRFELDPDEAVLIVEI
jgi:predicted nuclease of predicted toxin-antitoxin system